MYAESVLVYTIYVMILTHIDTITIVINITAPDEIMPPQVLVIAEVVSKEGVATKDSCREMDPSIHEVYRHHSTGILIHILLDEIPLRY